jgi:hypothetical protein
MMFLRPIPATLYRNRNQSAKEKGVDVFTYYCFHILRFFLDVLVLKPAIFLLIQQVSNQLRICAGFRYNLKEVSFFKFSLDPPIWPMVGCQRLSHGFRDNPAKFQYLMFPLPIQSHEFHPFLEAPIG